MIYFQTQEFLTDADNFIKKCLPALNISYDEFMSTRRTNNIFTCRQYVLQVLLAIYGVTKNYGEGAYIVTYAKIMHKKSKTSITNAWDKYDSYYGSDKIYQENYRVFFREIFQLYLNECKQLRAKILRYELDEIDKHEKSSYWENKRADLIRIYG